jgi:hypothetical protein
MTGGLIQTHRGQILALTPAGASGSIPPRSRSCSSSCPTSETAQRDLSARGLAAGEIQAFPWGRFVYFSDPDANAWAVRQIPDYR